MDFLEGKGQTWPQFRFKYVSFLLGKGILVMKYISLYILNVFTVPYICHSKSSQTFILLKGTV